MSADKRKEEAKKSGDPIGFRFAFRGLGHAIRTQRNTRIQLVVAVLVVVAGLVLGLTRMEWMLVIICIGMVLSAELFNTALEVLTDLVTPNYNKKAGLLKDVAAGAVLITAIAAAITGLMIFIPKIMKLTATWSGL
jgi:diacylglycerol kinase